MSDTTAKPVSARSALARAYEVVAARRVAHPGVRAVSARIVLDPGRTAVGFAPLPGIVQDVVVKLGDEVRAGDRLVLVASPTLAGLHHDARAASLALARDTAVAERIDVLVEAQATSSDEQAVAKGRARAASIASAHADARIGSLGVVPSGAGGYWLVATRSGHVSQLDAMKGTRVGPRDPTPIATVSSLDEVLAVADVPVRLMAAISRQGRAWVQTQGGGCEMSASIESISGVVDPERQTVPVSARIAGASCALRPNQFVGATFFPAGQPEVVVVPREAIHGDGVDHVVFVEVEDGRTVRRAVTLGETRDDLVEIAAGVASGERVVVRGQSRIVSAVEP